MGIIDDQARDLCNITPSDTNSISPSSPIAICVTAAGNLNVVTEAGYERAKKRVSAANPTDSQIMTEVFVSPVCWTLLTGLPAGFVLNARIRAVAAAGTTIAAANIFGYLP